VAGEVDADGCCCHCCWASSGKARAKKYALRTHLLAKSAAACGACVVGAQRGRVTTDAISVIVNKRR